MKRTYEDRAMLEEKVYNKKRNARSKKFVKDGGHRNNKVNCLNKKIDIEEIEEMFEN